MNIIKLIGKYWVKIDMYVVVVVLWVFVINPMQKDISRMAQEPRYSIQNDIGKPKVRKGGSIVISPESNIIDIKNDSTIKKKGFLKKLNPFKKNK
jgi:hypothetical protein